MASVTENFNGFVSLELGDAVNPTPWPTVPAGGLEMHQISGEVAGRPNALVRNRCPIAMDSLDHRASIEYRAFSATNEEWLGPAVRMKEVETTWYNISCNGIVVGVEKYSAEGYDDGFAGSFTNYVSHVVNIGDRLELRVSGTDPVILQVYHNDVLITDLGTAGTITDAEDDRIVTGNYTGLFAYSESDDQTARVDNFAAEDLGSSSEDFPLVLDSASLALAGQAIGNHLGMSIESGNLALQSFNVGLLADNAYVLSIAHATMSVEGQEIPFILATEDIDAALVLEGQDVNLFSFVELPVTTADMVLEGQDVTLRFGGNISLIVDGSQLVLSSSNIILSASGLSSASENIVASLLRTMSRGLVFSLTDIGRGN